MEEKDIDYDAIEAIAAEDILSTVDKRQLVLLRRKAQEKKEKNEINLKNFTRGSSENSEKNS